MNRIEKTLLYGCSYSVLIMAVFYLFALISGFTSTSVDAKTFFLCLCFGMLVSVMEQVYQSISLGFVYRAMIHYAVLLVAFCIIFVSIGGISGAGRTSTFVSIVVFTLLYLLIFLFVHFTRRGINKCESKIAKKQAIKQKSAGNAGKKEEKKPYTPLYKD